MHALTLLRLTEATFRRRRIHWQRNVIRFRCSFFDVMKIVVVKCVICTESKYGSTDWS